jgi:Ca-activated chloride channel family protein
MVSLDCRVNRSHVRARRKDVVFVSAETKAEGPMREAGTLDVCLAIDCSGSMIGKKFEMAKKAALLIASSLRPADHISVITFAGKAKVVVPRQQVEDRREVKSKIEKIRLGSKTIIFGARTNLYDGIRAGHEELASVARLRTARLILLTDGEPTTGPTSERAFVELSGKLGDKGISVTALGVGKKYNEDLLIAIAEASRGRWHHVVDLDQLPALFKLELLDMKSVVAVKPELHVHLLSGAELSNIYRVGTMVTEVMDYQKENGGYIIPLEDVRTESASKLVFKIHVPPRPEGEWKISKLTLVAPGVELTQDVVVQSTSDSSLWGAETDPYPRTLLTLAQATVVVREAIGDPTRVRQAQDLIETVMRDPAAATEVRKDPSLMNLGSTVTRVAETVVRGKLTEEDKKKLKLQATVIR